MWDRNGLMAWLAAYAAVSSTTMNYGELLAAATAGQPNKPAKSTTLRYRKRLQEMWLLDEVPAWHFTRSPFAGLASSPKHQLADPAFALRLSSIPASQLATLGRAYILGPLFESLGTLSVRVAVESLFGRVGHLRTVRGEHEVALIAEDQDGRIVAFEVKLSTHATDDDVRHLHWLREKVGDAMADAVVITMGTRAYRRPDGIAVVPLALLEM